MSDEISVRAARDDDLAALGALAGDLVRLHHATDSGRFFLPERVEQGYASWLKRELRRPGAVVLVAERAGEVVGYAYGTLEDRDWNALLDTHGAIHDVFVAATARRGGAGKRLVLALIEALEALGAPRVVLHTMVTNAAAQALFAQCGFRPTMVELTRNSA